MSLGYSPNTNSEEFLTVLIAFFICKNNNNTILQATYMLVDFGNRDWKTLPPDLTPNYIIVFV